MPKHRSSHLSSPLPSPHSLPGSHPSTSAVLVARQLPGHSSADVAGSLLELRRLLEGLGIRATHTVVQKRAGGGSLLGKGKRQEVSAALATLQAGRGDVPAMVVVNGELAPGQLRLLQNEWQVEIADRTDIILRVFAERARGRTAQLEVELAQLTYQAPRLRDDHSRDGREGGGGRGERGHTNVELRKQRI